MTALFERLEVLRWVREGQLRRDVEVARKARIPVVRLRDLEAGSVEPTLDELRAWLAALELREVDLGMLLEIRRRMDAERWSRVETLLRKGEFRISEWRDGALGMLTGLVSLRSGLGEGTL